MKDRESLFRRAEQYFEGTAEERRSQIKNAGSKKRLLLIAEASLHREIARGIVKPFRQLEEKLRGIKD